MTFTFCSYECIDFRQYALAARRIFQRLGDVTGAFETRHTPCVGVELGDDRRLMQLFAVSAPKPAQGHATTVFARPAFLLIERRAARFEPRGDCSDLRFEGAVTDRTRRVATRCKFGEPRSLALGTGSSALLPLLGYDPILVLG